MIVGHTHVRAEVSNQWNFNGSYIISIKETFELVHIFFNMLLPENFSHCNSQIAHLWGAGIIIQRHKFLFVWDLASNVYTDITQISINKWTTPYTTYYYSQLLDKSLFF